MLKLAAQPSILLSAASIASSGWDPSCIGLVDLGVPRSLPRLPFVAIGYSAASLSWDV